MIFHICNVIYEILRIAFSDLKPLHTRHFHTQYFDKRHCDRNIFFIQSSTYEHPLPSISSTRVCSLRSSLYFSDLANILTTRNKFNCKPSSSWKISRYLLGSGNPDLASAAISWSVHELDKELLLLLPFELWWIA